MRTLRRFRAPIGVLLALVMAMWQIASPLSVSAATYYWDINGATPGAGGPVVTGDWNSTLGTNWSTDPTGSSATAAWAGTGADTAVFSAGTDATGASVVTINQGGNIVLGALTVQEGNITINAASANDKLQFSNSAFLDGSVNVSAGSRLTVNAEVTGNAGLTKVGNGTLALTNNSNSYTGQTVINAGSLVITNNAQLGASTTTVAASGIASTGSFNGGQLVVQGGVAGTTISRDISVIGRGPSAANASGALISVGNNTFSGTVLLAGPASESRMASVYGTTTMTGQVVIGSGQGSLFYGNGNFVMTGQVTGFDAAQDRFIKTGLLVGTTLWLANNTNNFLSSIRIDSGTVRVSANGALGLNTTNIAVDLNNGALEIRTDALDFGTRKVRVRDFTTGTIFVDHAVGSSLINQTVAFSDLAANNNSTTFTFTGRNGYGASFTGLSGTIGAGGGGNATINNSSNGILFLNGNLWGQNDGTARVLTIQGNSETVVSGSILAPNAAAHAFTKAGSGTLTFTQGTADAASTFKGNTSINDGMLEIRTVKILNDTAASRIILGGGGLSYLGDTTTGAGETFTNKTFDLNAGTGIILANQAGTAPTAIILPNNFASTSTAAKTLVLGGSSTLNNTIQGVISNNTNLTSVTKVGPGTWQIDGPTAANYGTASTGLATTNTSGQATFTVASTAGLVVGQPISGAGVPVGAVITQINNGTTFTISAVTTAAVASVNLAPVSGNTAGYAASTNAANVVTVGSTAGLVVGQSISGTGIDPTGNWYISQITSATTFTIASATGAAALGNGTVTGALTLGSSANFAGTLAITGGVLRLNATSASGDAMNNTSGVTFAADTAITNLGSAGGTFEYAGFSSGSSETVGRLTPTAGLGIVKVTSGVSPATLTFLDLGARGAGSILNFQPGTGTISFATPPTLTNGIINGSALFNGVDWATMVGNNVAAYVGYTVTTGTIATGATQNIKVDNTSAGNVTMAASGNTDIFTLLANDAAARTIDVGTGNTLRIGTTLGGILVTAGSGGLTIGVAGSAGTLTTQSATSEIVLYNDAAVTINSVIANNTATSLTKGGSGVLSLNGNNTFTGGVVVNQGSIVLGHVAGLGVNGNVTLRPSTSLNLAGFAATINGLAGSGNVTNSGAAAIFSIGSANGSSVFAGVIANGAGTITMQKLGTGTIALTGLNTYTGGTIISNGTLIVTNLANGGLASSLGQSSNAASNLILGGAGTTGTLNYTGSSTTIYQTTKTPTVSIDRLFSLAGNGTIQSNGTYGNESVAAAGVQNNAALLFSNSGPIGFTTAGVKTLTLGGTSIGDNIMGLRLIDNTIDATALSVTKADAGLWILGNATNSYTGVTTISAGALQAVDGTSLPTASNLLLNGGVFQTFGTFDRAIGTGADQFRWNTNGSGGFSASTDRLFVNIGGAGVTLDWGTGGIGNGTGTLILSSTTALFDTVFVNGINLNGANRTIQVDDNGSTGLDYATIQGVISNGTGTAGFTKSGGGILILNDANTYNGNTTLNNGTLVIQSFGNSSGTTSGSLGASGGSFVFSNGTTGVNLIYAGAGEVATRPITISSGASTIRIDSSGSGALVLGGAITNSATGAVTLELRGLNTDFNRIDSVLANSGANVLTVTKADGGVWVLNPGTANTFTGNINISGGQLGLTANGIGAAAGIVFSNGALFAYGGPLAFSKNVTLANNTTAVFAGQYDITVTGNVIKSAGVNEQTLNNSLENGAVLTINGNYVNNETATATRLLQFRGFGSTVWNGIIQNNSGTSLTGINISMANNAMLTLSGAANTYTGGTTIGQGILLLNKVGALGPSGTFSLSGGEIRAGVDLSGAVNKIVNAVALTGDPVIFSGSNNIELGSATALTMGASRHVVNNIAPGTSLIISSGVTNTAAATLTISGSGTTLISSNVGTGTGAQALTYSGTGTLTLTGANTMTGTLTVNRGLVVMSGTTGGSVNAATAVAINAGGILRLDNSGGDNVAGRIAARPVTIQGGVLELIGDADGTTETAAALAVNSATASIVMSGAGPNVLRFASVAFNNTGSSLDLGGIAGLGTTNKVIFTTEPTESPVSTGILSRVFIGGNDFATHNSTDGVVAFTGYNNTNDLALAANTDTMNLTASANVANTRTLNALKINGSGLNIGGSGYTLTLTSGGVLNTGGNNTLSMEYLAFGGNAAFFQVKSGTTLTVNSAITGSGGLSKALGGTMILNSGTFMSSTTNVLDGTLVLNAGLNTLYAGSQVLSFGASGIVDLNGNVQYTGQISSAGGMPNTGGLITSGTGTGTLVTNMVGTATYAGQLTGANVNLVRLNGNTLTLESALTYGGQTHLLGGTTGLENDAALVNTTSIDINQATLSLNNNSSLQTNNNNRINDAATITLRGGTLTLNGRVNTATSEVLGALTVAQGGNTISSNWGGTGTFGTFSSADLTFASFSRAAGTTVNFTGSNLGSQGNNARINFGVPLAVVGPGVLGAWAIANTTDYAAYNPVNGVGVVGAGGYASYDLGFASGNITNVGGTSTVALTTTLSGTTTTGMLRLAGAFSNDIAFTTNTDVLNLEYGGLLRSNNNNTSLIGTTAIRGILTAGGGLTSGTTELVVYNAQSTTTINSVIANNGLGNTLAFVKSGAGTVALSAANTYTGGTTVNQGVLQLVGDVGTIVIPAGGLTLTGATVTMVTNGGQIEASNDVTLNGSSTLTLVGNNTLGSLTFNNNGGSGNPTVTVGGILTLTDAAAVTVTTSNAMTLPVISGGTLALGAGVKTFDIGAPTAAGQAYTTFHPSLSITSIITGTATINKTGNGLLQLSGQSTFSGGLNVMAGGIIVGANSTATTLSTPGGLVSGPLGTGAVNMAVGTRLLVDNTSRTVANAITFNGNPIFDNTGLGTVILALNGPITLPNGALSVNVIAPNLTAALAGTITNIGSITSITKTGLGNLSVNITGLGSTVPITMESGGALTLLHDGDGTGGIQTIPLGAVTFDGFPILTIGRAGTSTYYATAANKILAPTSITSLANGITLTASNGYGLLVADNIALNNGNLFTITGASNSNVVQALTLNGVVSGASSGLTKAGNGTLVLNNNANSFGGAGAVILINQGVIAVSQDSQLGNASNIIRLSPTAGTSTLRVQGTFATNRTIDLGSTANTRAIDVTGNNVFTLNTAFTHSGGVTAGLQKLNQGTLVLTQAQTGWDGVLTITQGTVRFANSGAAGTTVGGVSLANVAAGIELTGGITIADALTLTTGDNNTSNGMRGAGAIRSLVGTNTWSGLITMGTTGGDSTVRAATFTADAGATLNLTGGLVANLGTSGSNRDAFYAFGGAGTVNLTSTITHNNTFGVFTLSKFGSGTLNIQVANAFTGQQVFIKQGTLSLNGAGTLGVPTVGAPGTVNINQDGILTLDNVTTNVANRLSNRNMVIQGGFFNILGSAAGATNETTTGTLNFASGGSVITLTAGAGQQVNFTSGAITRSAASTVLFRGSNLGNVAGADTATIQATGTGYVVVGQAGATGTTNKGILPWGIIDTTTTGSGTSFATVDSVNGRVRALAAGEFVTTITGALANFENVRLSTTQNGLNSGFTQLPQTINSLQLNAGGGTAFGDMRALTIDSGGILALAGNTGILGGLLSTSTNREMIIHNTGDLEISSAIVSFNGGLTKTGAGILTLSSSFNNFTGQVTINEGTVKLAGGNNTIFPGQNMVLQGGALDLNGTVQRFNALFAQNVSLARGDYYAENTAGTVINTSGTQALLALSTANVNFIGRIGNDTVSDSDIAVLRGQGAGAYQDWNLNGNNTYTGATLFNGGRVQILDNGRLSGTSSIELSHATLLIGASNTSTELIDNTLDRVNNAATILIRGGMLQFRGRAGLDYSEDLGDVILAEGNAFFDIAEPGTAINSAVITLASLERQANSHATLRIVNVDGTIGSLARVYITDAPVLTNNIIGGWAVYERDFASYTTGTGLGALNTGGYAGYSPNTINTGLTTDNIRLTTIGTTTLTGNRNINALAMVVAGATTLDLGGFTLTLGSGGLIASNATDTTNITIQNGSITSGTLNNPSELFIHALSWQNNADTTNRDVILNASVVDNGTGPVTLVVVGDSGRGAGYGTNQVILQANNTHTGGTIFNSGNSVLNLAGANGTTLNAVPGDLTITGGTANLDSDFRAHSATVTLLASDQIKHTANLTLLGGSTLNLNNFNQTLAGVTFNNTGGNTPTLAIGTGTFRLNGNITATSQNISTASAITSSGVGNMNLNGATRTFNVDAVKWNGQVIDPLLVTLNISALIQGTGSEGIIKTGDGLLQLSAQNTFTGGVDLQQGGIAIGGSSTPSTLGAIVTTGPLGSGTFKIGANTYLTSTGTNTLANNLNLNNNLTFRGANSLTFNGNATLTTGGTFTVNVEEANFTAVFNGLINANADFGLVKNGFGTLRLSNYYNQVSGVTLNQGTLDLFSTGLSTTSQIGNAGITMNGGLLMIRNNGGGGTPVGVVIDYGNDLTLGAALTDAQIHIGNASAGTNNLIQLGKLTTTVNNQGVSLSAANGYNLRFIGADINTQARFAIQSATTLTVLLSNVGVSQSVTGLGTIVAGGDNYVNTGAGTLVVGVGVKANTTTDMPGGPFNFAPGTNTFIPLAGTLSNAGYTQGGLLVRQTSYAATQNLNSVVSSGVGPTATFTSITPPGDTAYNNRPPSIITTVVAGAAAQFGNSIATYSGLLQITAGGTYSFRTSSDDQAVLFIDGVMVLSDNVNGGGHGLTETGTATIELSAGYHSIVFMGQNATGGGGFNILYAGPDTTGNNITNGFQSIDPDKLYYTTNLGSVANGFLNAAIISDAYNLPSAQASTLDGQGTHFNLMFGSLTLGATSTLTVQNQFGTGYYGVVGTTTIGGAGAIVNPTTGTLYLAGGVNDGAALGLTKNGAGSLYLGTSTNFTGTFTMNSGFVLLAGANALSTGSNIVNSGVHLDLYGNSSGGSVTLNGGGMATLNVGSTAALWNSLANTTGTLTGDVTIGSTGTRIGGLGDIVLSGALSDGAALGFTKIGPNTLTLSGNNVGFTGVASVTNGILKLGSNTALGTGGTALSNTVISSGAVLDLNGTNIATEFLSVAGTGFTNRNGQANPLAAIINSSNTAATFGGPITMTAATSIGSSRLNALSGVPTAGDITLSGAVTGAFALTKVGSNTLFVTGSGNTYNGIVINGGRVVVSGAGQLGTGANHVMNGYGQPTGIIPSTTLQLDNTATASNSRLGSRALSMRNSHLIIDGHATTAVNENLGANALDIALGHSVITLNHNGANVTLTAGSLTRNGSATLVIRGSDDNIGVDGSTGIFFTTAPIPVGTENTAAQFNDTDTSGILPWILIDNGIATPGLGPQTLSFARYDTILGLTNLVTYATDLPTTGTANGTGDVNLAIVFDLPLENPLGADQNLQTTGVNSITFTDQPSDLTVTLDDLQILTLDSGGILALSSGTFTGNGSLNVAGNRQFVIHTIGASTVLNANVELGGRLAPTTGGLVKTGEGTLILGERNNYTGSTVVNLGTLKLDGGDNTILYSFTTGPAFNAVNGTPQGQILAVAPGGIVDLNGTDQTVNLIQGNGGQNVAGAGGIITNTNAAASDLRLVVNGNVNWQGSINGNTNLIKSGGSTTIFYDNNAYSGTTLIQGGVFSLQDQGRLSGTSGITVSRAVLRWDDTGMQQMTNRLGATTPITLNGAALNYLSRGGTDGVMDIGSIHLAGGASYISATPNAGTATVKMGALTRTVNSTITFAAGTGTPGANPFFYFDSAPTLTNGMIGGWAYAIGVDAVSVATNIEFATYDTATGVRMLSATQLVSHFNDPTANVRFGASATVKTGGAVINSLTLNNAAITLSFAAANDVLNITSGGLLGGLDNNGKTIGSIALPGILTAGGVNPASDVYLYVTNASNNMQINSIIADNPTNGAKLHLVLGSAGRNDNTARVTLANANTYTGTTYINGVRVDLANTTGSGNAITGDLIIAGGIENTGDSSNPDAVRVLNRAHNQIADTANVTMLGGSSWELFGFNETINNLNFQNDGGSRNNSGPRVQTGTGVLTLNGNVTATNLVNASAISLIAGNINFGVDNALSVTVDKVAGASNGTNQQIGLAMNVNVVGGGTLTKLGAGMLSLGGQSNSVLQVNVAAGDLSLFTGASYLNTTVNLASGTRLDMRGLANVVLGNLTGSGTLYNYHINATGTLVTGGANADATFTGIIGSEFTSGMISVTKVGTGTWTLTADNSQQLSNTLVLLDGGILLNSATARLGFATQNISTGGVLTLDNSTNALNFRLGGPVAENSTGIRQSPQTIGSINVNLVLPAGDPNINRNVNMQGGTINLIGGSTNVVEAVSQVAMLGGASTINMTASSAETVFITNTLAGVNNGILYLNAVGTGAILGGTKGAGHVNFAATTPTLVGAGGAAGTTTMSIRPDIIGTDSTGTGFVTHDDNGLRILTAAEYKTPDVRYLGAAAPVRITVVPGAPVGTVVGTTENVRTGTEHSMDNSTTVNSLTLLSGGGVESSAGGMLVGAGQGESLEGRLFNGSGTLNTLQISSGGLLAFAGNTGIHGGAVTAVANRLYITAMGNLDFDAYILGTQSIVKSGAGTMTLRKKTLNTGILSLHEGTLVLAGGDNTILVAPGAGAATQLDFNLNGGTLDLNGNDQAFGRLTTTSADTTPNGAGDVTNAGALATLSVNTQAGSVTYSGNVSGAINLVKGGANTWTLTGAHSYTGATIVRGGVLQLRDSAVLANTSSIEINYSSLFVDNTGWQGISRLGTGVNVTLRGGNFQFTPRQSPVNVETIGVLTFAEGMSRTQFNAVPLGGSFTLNATSLARNNDATWFATPGTGVLGRGNGDNGDQSPQIILTTAPTLINGIIGGWAIHNGDNWLTYQSTVHSSGGTGVGVFSDTGAGFLTYDEDTGTVANFSAADSIATRNMRIQNGTYTVADIGGAAVSGNFLLNSLAFLTNTAGQNLVFADNPDVLYLTAGAFLKAGNVTGAIGSAVDNGNLTSGVVGATGLQHLYLHNNQSSLTLNSRIVDNNASAAVRLVLWSANSGNFILTNGGNTYTGGTVVQGNTNVTTVQMNIANAIPAGGLTINDTNVITNTAASVINGVHASNIVTINGGGILNLTTSAAVTNTLAGLVFNNKGSTTTPQVQIGVSGSTLILTGTNAITATNENYQTLPTIAVTTAGNLQFSAAAPVITVNNPSGIATHGLLINAVIQTNAGWTQALTKDGNGMLSLAVANTFAQGILLKDGGLVLGNAAALGTGKLTVGDGVAGGTHTLMTNGVAALTITNLIDLNEDLIIGGTNAGTGATVHNLTASGAVALGSGDRVITVESPTVTFTVSGVVSSTGGGLIKDGDGILQLNNAANSYTGDTRVKRGLLRQGGANVLAGSDLIVESAGTVDMNGNAMTVRSLSGEDGQHGGVITNNANNTQTLTVGDVLASLDTTFAGIVTDNRAVQGSSRVNLVKTGDSRQKLAGLNSYGGTTVVNSTTTTLGGGGHLQVGVGGVGQTGTGATTVNAGSTLSGSGLINGTPGSTTHVIASAGTLSPGDSYGTVNGVLTFNGNLTLAAGSQSLLQVTSRTAHTTSVSSGGYVNAATSLGAELNTLNNTALPLGAHDALQINGTLNATGGNATTLFRVLDNGYLANAAAGDVFDLLDWTVGVTFTTFSAGTNFRAGGTGGGDLELPTLLGGNTWDVSAFTSHGLLVVVPEPSKAMLLFGSLLLMCFYRRRRAA